MHKVRELEEDLLYLRNVVGKATAIIKSEFPDEECTLRRFLQRTVQATKVWRPLQPNFAVQKAFGLALEGARDAAGCSEGRRRVNILQDTYEDLQWKLWRAWGYRTP